MNAEHHQRWQQLDGAVDDPPDVMVRTHPALCRGWGDCHRWAPNVYPLDEHGHVGVHRLHVPAEDAEDAYWGAKVCPEHTITVVGPSEGYWEALHVRRSAERLAQFRAEHAGAAG